MGALFGLIAALTIAAGDFFSRRVTNEIGPIVAALFVTVWDIYGIAFKDVLPEIATASREAENTEE